MENATQQSLVNWKDFDIQDTERVKIEEGKPREIGFSSIKQTTIEVADKEATDVGKMETKKQIPVLVLGVDWLDGKPAKKELMISSKRLIGAIKAYFEKDLLFRRKFQIQKTGTGYQTSWQLYALDDKPSGAGGAPPLPFKSFMKTQAEKENDVEAFL